MPPSRYALPLAVLAAVACREPPARRAEAPPPVPSPALDAAPPRPPVATPDAGATAVARVAPGSQPRWRHLARGPRPRGGERWRLSLAPREAVGDLATDGRTVFVPAASREREREDDGEVLALDLADGSVRWHVPVGGLHGAPLELVEGLVLVDTIPHCRRRGPDPRRCAEPGAGGVVALDAATGRERFRSNVHSGALHATFTAVQTARDVWVHDGLDAVRALALPAGTTGARVAFPGAVPSLTAAGADLLYAARTRRGTRVGRRVTTARRPAWERPLPYDGPCPVLVVGPIAVVGAFSTPAVTGAARALSIADGSDVWSADVGPHQVDGCGAVENATLYQLVDGRLQATEVVRGYRGAAHPLPGTPTSAVTALLDGIFYASFNDRLLGLDVVDGHVTVTVPTGAESVAGLVVWNGRGAVATRGPGVVVGFD